MVPRSLTPHGAAGRMRVRHVPPSRSIQAPREPAISLG